MKTENEKRAPVPDSLDRVSEIIFGLMIALTFTGTISAATAGRKEVRTVTFAALGCNLAWETVDTVMCLIRTLTERARNLTLLRSIGGTQMFFVRQHRVPAAIGTIGRPSS